MAITAKTKLPPTPAAKATIAKGPSGARLMVKLTTAWSDGKVRVINPHAKSVTKPIRVKAA